MLLFVKKSLSELREDRSVFGKVSSLVFASYFILLSDVAAAEPSSSPSVYLAVDPMHKYPRFPTITHYMQSEETSTFLDNIES